MKTASFSLFPKILAIVLAALFLVSLGWFTYVNFNSGQQSWDLLISTLLLSVPLGLLYFSIGVLVISSWQRRSQGQINARLKKALYRTPRIAGVLIVLFVAMFALDVFEGDASIWEMIGAFLIHALPAIVMAIVLAMAWKREWIGFLAFLLLGIFFLRFLLPNPLENFGHLLLFSGPMLMIALLFGANWRWRSELHPLS